MTKEIIINKVNVSECEYLNQLDNGVYECILGKNQSLKYRVCACNHNCHYKQLKRQQYYLEKIRAYELNSLDVDWDEYEQHACDTEYSPIVDFVELALGEKEDE